VVHTVPNGEIKVASNRTRTWARINQDVMVAFGTDIDKAIDVVEELGRTMAADPVWKRRILEPPRVERIESIDELGITLKILGCVRASDQWAASGEFRKLLLDAFAANGIEIPQPRRVVISSEGGTAILSPDGPSQDDLANGD
jgi:small conductance mechanosensitive channel